VQINNFSAEQITQHRDGLVALLQDAVNGGASVNFLAPLATDLATVYWDKVAAEVSAGERTVLVAWEPDTASILGCAHLVLALQPNATHRAEVQKVLVHKDHRRQGIGTALMQTIEQEARQAQRTLLVLDTSRDGGAESLYERCGYIRAGLIPNYAIGPYSGFVDTIYYYRAL
jgi:ribosomal protein S18 acetylase RimI-like enzyme